MSGDTELLSTANTVASVQLRPMHLSDMVAVVEIERRAHITPWSEATLRECLVAGYACEVLQRGPQLVAFSVARVGPDDLELLNLCVSPEMQRRGFGRQLLGSVVQRARALGVGRVLLEVRESNRSATVLYTRSGFRPMGLRKHYYRTAAGGTEHALSMSLDVAN